MSNLLQNGLILLENGILTENNEKNENESKLQIIIEILFRSISQLIKFIGPFFFLTLCLFVFLVSTTFFSVILPYYEFGKIFELILKTIAFYLIIQVFFNYLMAFLIKPGSLYDLNESHFYKENSPYINSNINFNEIFKNSKSNRYCKILNGNNTNKLKENFPKFCKYCKDYKPIRSHHCSICQSCVFKMDHHCPWINNCVGQNNLRYFILFLTWMLIGCSFILITSSPILLQNKEIFYLSQRKKTEFGFVVILCLAGLIILFLFNIWNWFLLLKGLTTIEFWTSHTILSKNNYTVINDFSLGWKTNFFLVFGTKNVFQALFIPTIKKLPYSGLEWSKLVYENIKFNNIINISYNTLSNIEEII